MGAQYGRCAAFIAVVLAASCDSDSDPAPVTRVVDAKPSSVVQAEEKMSELLPPNLPDFTSVTRIIAELYNSPIKPNVPPFEVPRQYWAALTDSLGHPQCEPMVPPASPEVGSLRFEFGDGSVSRMTWWTCPGGPTGLLHYAYLNVPCVRDGVSFREYGDEGAYLENLMRVIYERQTGVEVGGDETVFEAGDVCAVMANSRIREQCRENQSIGVPLAYRTVRVVHTR